MIYQEHVSTTDEQFASALAAEYLSRESWFSPVVSDAWEFAKDSGGEIGRRGIEYAYADYAFSTVARKL